MTSWFVEPEETRIDLSNGQWLQVKKFLTAGESRRGFSRMVRSDGNGRGIDPMQVGLSKIVSYLIEWSLTDGGGRHVSLRGMNEEQITAHVDQLHEEQYAEILAAIQRHEDAGKAEKKILFGDNASSPISQSPDTSVGDTNGLVN